MSLRRSIKYTVPRNIAWDDTLKYPAQSSVWEAYSRSRFNTPDTSPSGFAGFIAFPEDFIKEALTKAIIERLHNDISKL